MATDEQFKLFEQNLARKVEEHYRALVAALQSHLTVREQTVFAFEESCRLSLSKEMEFITMLGDN